MGVAVTSDNSAFPLGWSITISIVLAGVMVVLVSIAIEKLGGIKGGILGSVPTTIIPAAFGIWMQYQYMGSAGRRLTQEGVINYQKSMMAVPLGMLLNVFYLLMWRYLPSAYRRRYPALTTRRLLVVVTLTAIAVWAVLAIGTVFLQSNAISPHVDDAELGAKTDITLFDRSMLTSYCVTFSAILVAVTLGITIGWRPPPAPRGSTKVPPRVLLFRGISAGLCIGVSVAISTISSYAGGVMATFPVIFTTSMVAVWLSSGEAVSSGAIGSLLLGTSSVSVFAVTSAFVVPALGFGAGVVISWVTGVVLVSLPSFFYLRWRRSVVNGDLHLKPGEEEVTGLGGAAVARSAAQDDLEGNTLTR
ncbi:hypothetical protein RI367_000697 [Sorochytrium milnesiophthora]